jgi:transposase-like protein
MAYSMEVRKQFIKLRAAGLSYNKISAEIGVVAQTLKQWNKKYHKEILASEYDRKQQCRPKMMSALEESLDQLERINKAIKAKDYMNEDLKTLVMMRKKTKESILNMGDLIKDFLENSNNNEG